MTTQIIVQIIILLLKRYAKRLSKEQQEAITEAAKGNLDHTESLNRWAGD